MKRTTKNLLYLFTEVLVSALVILMVLGTPSFGVAAQISRWHNITGAICYIHIEWPNGDVTNFVLQPHETEELSLKENASPPKYCWSHTGPITDCIQACRRGDAKGTWSVSTTAMNGCEPGVASAC
jgi:hypothetical protein